MARQIKSSLSLFGQFQRIKNQSGMSIIEVIAAAGIMSVIGLSMVTMMVNEQKEVKALSEKLVAKDIEVTVKNIMTSSNYCGCLFRGNSFNSVSLSFNKSLNSIPSSYTVVPPAVNVPCTPDGTYAVPALGASLGDSKVKVSGIGFSDIKEITPGGGLYSANLKIDFDPGNLVRPLKSVKSAFFFRLDTASGAPSSRPLATCSSVSTSGDVVTGASSVGNVGIWSHSYAPASKTAGISPCPLGAGNSGYCYPSNGYTCLSSASSGLGAGFRVLLTCSGAASTPTEVDISGGT